MKKTLFVKFLFLLLCGSVLTTAGCKDYDDDIDALRNDVEDLKGAVVELNGFENRIAALERTQAAFEAIDFSGFAKKSDISSLQTQIEGCVKDSDLAAKIVAAIESSLADGALQESLSPRAVSCAPQMAKVMDSAAAPQKGRPQPAVPTA